MTDKLIIDSREQKRIELAKEYFTDLDYTVEVQELKTGDYIINDGVVFEYKTQSDFISSILDGRVFNECINQSEKFEYHFCIIQGTNRDRKHAFEYTNQFTIKQYYGAIARLNTYTTVIQSTGTVEDAFYQMHIQAAKCLDNKGKVKHFDAKSGNPAFNTLCYCLDDVANERAKAIVNHLGLKTWSDVYHLTKQDLLKVPGIGEKTSESIICQINERG